MENTYRSRCKKGELYKKIGISSSTLSKMSRNEPMSLSIILKICKILDCSIEESRNSKQKE